MLNLINLIGATMHCCKHGTGIHAIGEFYEFKHLLSYEDFVERVEDKIEDYAYERINSIIPTVKDNKLKTLELKIDQRIHHTDYWKDEALYKERLTIYKHNLNILKTK